QRFLAPSRDSLDLLNRMGVDLGESLDRNADGSIWIPAVVTAAQRDYLAGLGFRPGDVIQTEQDAENAQAEMAATGHREVLAQRAAKPGKPAKRSARSTLAASETLKVTRADYYQSSSGTWLSVEAKSSAAQGNAAVAPGSPGCPTTGSNRCGIFG